MTTPIVPQFPILPREPASSGELLAWARDLSRAQQSLYGALATRAETEIQQGTAAQRPTANGKRRFYYATDTLVLYYDDGVWRAITSAGGGYATVQEEGVALTTRTVLNFIGSAITAADNAGSARTDVTLSQSPAGSTSVVGTGRLVSASTGLTGGGDLSADRTFALTVPVSLANGGTNNTATPGSGAIIYSDGAKLTSDVSNLFYDATNKRVGVAIAAPLAGVHAKGIIIDPGALASSAMNPRGPLFILNNQGANVAGEALGQTTWVGNNPTGTPGVNNAVAHNIYIDNANSRHTGGVWGMDIQVLQAAAATDCQMRGIEVENNNLGTFVADAFAGGNRKTGIEFIGHTSSTAKVTAAMSVWVNDATGANPTTKWYDSVIQASRVTSTFARLVKNPGTDTDTVSPFAKGIFDCSSLTPTAVATIPTLNLLLAPTASNSVTRIKNGADFDAGFAVDSGNTAAKNSYFMLSDRGTPQWYLYKNSGFNDLSVLNSAGTNVMNFSGTAHGVQLGSAIASANTITLTSNIHHITGTTLIKTITPAAGFNRSGIGGVVHLIADGLYTTDTTGNIAVTFAPVVGRANTLVWDSALSKWYPVHSGVTAARRFLNVAQSLTTATWTNILLDTNTFDRGPLYSGSTIVIPEAGTWEVYGQITFAGNATGVRRVGFTKNVTTPNTTPGPFLARALIATTAVGELPTAVVSTMDEFAAADVIRLVGYQNSGGALNATNGTDLTFMTVKRVR